jgi:hypothetical protein
MAYQRVGGSRLSTVLLALLVAIASNRSEQAIRIVMMMQKKGASEQQLSLLMPRRKHASWTTPLFTFLVVHVSDHLHGQQ